MPKLREMPRLRLVMLHVSAVDYGTHYVVIDRNGRQSSRLKHADTGTLTDQQLSRIKRRIRWRFAIWKMMRQLQNANARQRHVDEWDVKVKTWQNSMSLRQKDSQRKRHGRRFFTTECRPNWDRAYECMLRQYYNKVVRKQRHNDDPWSLWAETVSRNHNRKERQNESRNDS